MKKKRRMSIHDKAEAAMKQAIKKVVAEHKKAGRPLAIWVNGKVKRVMPK